MITINEKKSTVNLLASESPWRIFRRFLRFGLLAWGGPIAQIAMIRHELVEEARWVSNERFNRVLAVYQALPGPEAHELCVYFGTVVGGRIGGLLAGLGFMLPGFLLMLLLSWVYVTYGLGSLLFAAAFYGMQPAVAALIIRGLQRIGSHALHDRWLWAIALGSLGLQLLGVNFVLTLLAAGLVYMLVRQGWLGVALVLGVVIIGGAIVWWVQSAAPVASPLTADGGIHPASLGTLALAGLRTGLLTFGGAYSAIGFLRQDAVNVGGWLSDSQFLDGIALGGILPAPLIIFGTFVGYLAGGLAGAVVMTIGIFLPAFSFSLIGHEVVERLIDTPGLHTILDGITAGVVGIIAATTWLLLPTAITDVPTTLIFVLALGIVVKWKSKASTPVAVLLGALIGWLVQQIYAN